MGLYHKTVKRLDRSMYLYYPDIPRHNPDLVTLLVVLRGEDSRESAEALLDAGLRDLSERHHVVLAFPDPLPGGWNSGLDEDKPDDLAALDGLLQEVTKEDDDPLKTNEIGIPELSEMLRQWHLMNMTRYLAGVDGGADMAYAYAACRPDNISAVLGFGGGISAKALEQASYVPVAAALTGASAETAEYFVRACGAEPADDNDRRTIYRNAVNPVRHVVVGKGGTPGEESAAPGFGPGLLEKVWQETFSKVRRLNTGKVGDLRGFTDLSGPEFTWVKDDDRLGDGKHTWLTHVPSTLEPGEKVPLVVFYHGGSDNPTEAAEMARLHELGRKEHFITVYPWGSNTASWNINYDESEGDEGGFGDEKFGMLLIDYMIANYPVDPQRVYLSGFSNGAAMAQVIAMLYPERIAGLMHIDSNWPGNRWKPTEVDIDKIPAMRRALEQKPDWMRMPVWYTYGTREASCPVYRGCTQQYQYDFWKKFNNIEVKPTQEVGTPDACESGVAGDVVEIIRGVPMYPDHYYVVNRFYTRDADPKNYYNYVLMHDKGHEVAPMDPVLGWNYVKQFRRNPDGTVGLVGE